MLNIHRILLRRLLISWLLISLGIGVGLFWYGVLKIDDRLVELAVAESSKISGEHLAELDKSSANSNAIEYLAERLVRENFVLIKIYGRDHRLLIERVNPRFKAIEDDLKRQTQRFPQDQNLHYSRFMIGESSVLTVLVPIRDHAGTIGGYFDGIFLVDHDTLARMKQDLAVSLAITLATVFSTTLVLYPVILSLNREVVRYSHELLKGNMELMEVLGGAIAKRDSDTNIHNYRVSIYAVRLAESVGQGAEAIRNLIVGAFLHDVGKIGISDNILLKPAKLTADEFAVMKTHVTLGIDILDKSSWLQTARDVVEYHHEKMDGSGYMRGLAGDEIPINARIFAIVDVFDALTSKRPYKEALPFSEAMDILRNGAGSHFDPRLLNAFFAIAEPLYSEVSATKDEQIGAYLKVLIVKYFFQT